MLLDPDDSHLVLLDLQERVLPAMADRPGLEANALRLARGARLLGVPGWATEHNPAGLGATDPTVRALVDTVVPKMSFSAAEPLLARWRPARPPQGGNARSLPKHLRKPAEAAPEVPGAVVLAGCETHVCVLQTALDLLDHEVDVWVVTDACASRRDRDRDAAFDRLAGAGCELVTTEMVLFEWLRDCEHPAFREVLALVK